MIGMTVCSGIGAPEVAAPWIDWRYQSEIEPFPCAVLKQRFPDAINLGDMTKFKEWPDANIDVLCGGTPCQSFSIAGMRKGLDDPRGNLMLTYLAIAERYDPRWIVWENVTGVLSSNGGRDFGALLGGLAKLGYGFVYRVLDAQYTRTRNFPFAVPQRRRRVFVVGYLGDWRRAAAVLFDAESLRRNPSPRREAGKDVAGTLGGSSQSGGFRTTDLDNNGAFIVSHDAAPCLTARERKGALPEADLSAVVAHTLKGEGFDASEDGTGRGTPIVPVAIQERAVSESPSSGPDGVGVRQDGAAYTLEARSTVQAVAFDCKGTEVQTTEDGSHPPLRSMGHHHSHQNAGCHAAVAFDTTQITSPGNFSQPKPGDPCHPLAAGAHPPAVAWSIMPQNSGKDYKTRSVEVSQPLMAGGPVGGNQGGDYIQDHPWAVRRLTPTECERLMGFPDGWTAIEWRGKPADQCPDGPRYKALGNSWAVNSGEYIFDRIKMVEDFFA